MCAITGFWIAPPPAREEAEYLVRRMAGALRHRGPGDKGTWYDVRTGRALGHRRLPIIHLSLAGHQPMLSTDGRWVTSFNSEFYNFLELKANWNALEIVSERERYRSQSGFRVGMGI